MLLTGVDAAAVRQSQQEQKEADGEDPEKRDGGAQCSCSLSEKIPLFEKMPFFCARQERCSTILPRKCAWTQRNELVQSRHT